MDPSLSLATLISALPSLSLKESYQLIARAILAVPKVKQVHIFEYDRGTSGFKSVVSSSDLFGAGANHTSQELQPIFALLRERFRDVEEIRCRFNDTEVHRCFVISENALPATARKEIEAILNLLTFVFNDEILSNILVHMHRPIDYDRNFKEFILDIKVLCRMATGMQMGALRRLTSDGMLECLFVWGPHETEFPLEQWDVRVDDEQVFKRALDNQSIVVVRSPSELSDTFRSRPEQARVRSFVAVPVLVGNGNFGVMTAAQESPYQYGETEKQGFLSIANAVGISIKNFEYFHASRDLASINAAISTALTGVEVAQAVRHEARDLIDDCFTKLTTMRALIRKGVANKADEFLGSIEQIDEKLLYVSQSLDKIRDATQIPLKDEAKEAGIEEIWKQAANQVSGKLHQNGIDLAVVGKDTVIKCYPDRLRQVFLNLISNSIEAFKVRGKKRDRRITLSIEPTNEREHSISMVYSDNAGGIDRSSLIIPETLQNEGFPLGELIFQKYVSSRPGGGWGLPLVRKMLDEHKGSINLKSSRGGVEFAIHVRKDPLA